MRSHRCLFWHGQLKQPQIYRYAGLCCHQVWRQTIWLVENKQHGFSSYVREKLGKDEPLNVSCNVFHSSTDFLFGAMAGVTLTAF